jgi:hypothetical protein
MTEYARRDDEEPEGPGTDLFDDGVDIGSPYGAEAGVRVTAAGKDGLRLSGSWLCSTGRSPKRCRAGRGGRREGSKMTAKSNDPEIKSSDIARARATLRYSCEARFQSPTRRSYVLGPAGAIINAEYDEQATVYAEFVPVGDRWTTRGEWRWSVKSGRHCEFTDQV